MPKYQNASDEPLDIIEANECEGLDLTSKRFRRLFNEIYALRAAQQSVEPTDCDRAHIKEQREKQQYINALATVNELQSLLLKEFSDLQKGRAAQQSVQSDGACPDCESIETYVGAGRRIYCAQCHQPRS